MVCEAILYCNAGFTVQLIVIEGPVLEVGVEKVAG